ncbi:hypothetical protein SETIT_8G120800v2 [Setaria italica]|uniref:Uncharacterized protein n=2 Tax=Setaria TaxID=4554 RepID=A0A368S6W0_SETIT|nr:hypothetical protein SETIT_8G120800v2 [Setaria italica]TKW00670.1 hypothetical protein SEVIR_8G127000v2 [Setaria viridis]
MHNVRARTVTAGVSSLGASIMDEDRVRFSASVLWSMML